MVADFLEADGWRVVFLGQLTPGSGPRRAGGRAGGDAGRALGRAARARAARSPRRAPRCAAWTRRRSCSSAARRSAAPPSGRCARAPTPTRTTRRRRPRPCASASPRRHDPRADRGLHLGEHGDARGPARGPTAPCSRPTRRSSGSPAAGSRAARFDGAHPGRPARRVRAPARRRRGRWSGATFAFSGAGPETATDRRVWLRRTGDAVLLVAEPAVGEQEHLVEKVLELNDELVVAHRELVRQREELRSAAARIHNLEAISAPGWSTCASTTCSKRCCGSSPRPSAPSARSCCCSRAATCSSPAPRSGSWASSSTRSACRSASAWRAGSPRRTSRGVIRDLSQVEVHSAYLRESSRSMAGVPLTLDGKVIGVLHVSSGDLDRFGEDDLGLLVPAAERAALAIGRARNRRARAADRRDAPAQPAAASRCRRSRASSSRRASCPARAWRSAATGTTRCRCPSGELAVVIGDVAGKGLRAATLMGELRAGLRAYAIEGGGPMRHARRGSTSSRCAPSRWRPWC